MLDYLGKQEIYKDIGHPKEEMEVVNNDILQGNKRKERRVSSIERFLTF